MSNEIYTWLEDAVTRGVSFRLEGNLLVVGKAGDEAIDVGDDRYIKAHRYEIAEVLRAMLRESSGSVN